MQWITAIGVEDENNVIYSSNQDTLHLDPIKWS